MQKAEYRFKIMNTYGGPFKKLNGTVQGDPFSGVDCDLLMSVWLRDQLQESQLRAPETATPRIATVPERRGAEDNLLGQELRGPGQVPAPSVRSPLPGVHVLLCGSVPLRLRAEGA